MPTISDSSTAYELRDKLREVLADYDQDDQLRALVMAIAGRIGRGKRRVA
jgi:hypothetical protein